MISLREAKSDEELGAWLAVKQVVVPNEAAWTVERMRSVEAPDRLVLLAELGGVVAGCGLADRSHLAGLGFVAPRALPAYRRRGVGTALLNRLGEHVRALGLAEVVAYVDGADPGSAAFARRFGLCEVDRQVEQVRALGEEDRPTELPGVELVSIAERPELVRAAYELAREGYADMPLVEPVEVSLEEWLREEATLPGGSFAALAEGELVGYAGLLALGPGSDAAEHGLTVVRRDRRRCGLATALKRRQLAWAGASGLRELVTWTQRGNEGMRRVNELLGYRTRSESLTMRGPVPSLARPPASLAAAVPVSS